MEQIKKNRWSKKRRQGQAMVEFVLVSPLLFALIFGMIEFSMFGYHKMMMQYATRDMARAEAIGANDNSVDQPHYQDPNAPPGPSNPLIGYGKSYQAFISGLSQDQINHVIKIRIFHTDANWNANGDELDFDNQGNIIGGKWQGTSYNGNVETSTWLADKRCVGMPSSAFGIDVTYWHHWLTAFLPGDVTLHEIVYMRSESQVWNDIKPQCTNP